MGIVETQLMVAGILFALILLSGFWVSRSGRSYNALALAVHKLISLGTVALLVVAVVRTHRSVGLDLTTWAVSGVAVVLFFATIATGGMLSTEVRTPPMVKRLHHITPYLTILASGIALTRLDIG
jgi:hypothetical protein